MPIFSHEGIRSDGFRHLDDQESVPPDGQAFTVSGARWRSDRTVRTASGPKGVRLAPEDAVEELAGQLQDVALVTVELPKFKDGRAFSQARLLRSRLGFKGEVRARGHVIPDQLQFLMRCGVDSVEIPEDAHVETWSSAMRRFQAFYQTSIRGRAAPRHED